MLHAPRENNRTKTLNSTVPQPVGYETKASVLMDMHARTNGIKWMFFGIGIIQERPVRSCFGHALRQIDRALPVG